MHDKPFLLKSICQLFIATVTVVLAYGFAGLLVDNGLLAQSTATPLPTSTTVPLPTHTITVTTAPTAPVPLLIFATPPPVHTEEPLASSFRNVPAVFAGINSYHAIQADVILAERTGALSTTPLDAHRLCRTNSAL